MRVLHLVALTAISLLSLSSQCGKDAPTPAPPQPQNPAPPVALPPPVTPPVPACARTIAFTQVPGLLTFPHPSPIMGQSINYVVNSAAVYEALFTGVKGMPTVDFATHTLLIGKVRLSSTGGVFSQQVVQTCTGSYTYTVKVQPGAGTAITEEGYHALIDKLPANAQVDFDVQVLPF